MENFAFLIIKVNIRDVQIKRKMGLLMCTYCIEELITIAKEKRVIRVPDRLNIIVLSVQVTVQMFRYTVLIKERRLLGGITLPQYHELLDRM